jgi:hypothetical protein
MVIPAAIVIAAATAGAFVMAGRSDSGSAASTQRGSNSTLATLPPAAQLGSLNQIRPPRKLSHADPLRVWVGGDSLAGELGPALGRMLAPTGVVSVTVDFKVSSGLHDNGLRNWPVDGAQQMVKYSPDVAVFMIGANDASIVGGDRSRWDPAYRAKVDTMMDLLVGTNHRTVLWIGPPTMQSKSFQNGAEQLTQLMAEEAAKRPDVIFVNAFQLFGTPKGDYSSHIDTSAMTRGNGITVRIQGDPTRDLVRISDGVHFTLDGQNWIAYTVAGLLDQRWQILAQAGGSPITVYVESGGGSIPGYTPDSSAPSSTSSSVAAPASSTTGATSSTVAPSSTTSASTSTTAAPTTTVPASTTT